MGATRTYEIERLLALSDGIFAIVITLLVLDLKLPEPPLEGSFIGQELIDNIPDFIGWAVSFIVLSRLWMIHHHVIARLRRVRTGTIVANFAFLGAISLVPFGASLVGTYEWTESLAVVVFSFSLGLSAFLLGVFTWCAMREESIQIGNDHDLAWHLRHHLVVVPILSVAAAVLAFIHPISAMLVWVAEAGLVVMVLVAGAGVRHRRGLGAPHAGASQLPVSTKAP
jgi:uncharacterized membrane protein